MDTKEGAVCNGKLSEKEKNKDELCSWGPFSPSCCQRFRRPVCILVCLCVAMFLQNIAVVGFTGINTSTLERRFQLSSTQSGLIPSFYEIAGVPALLPLTYIGGRAHRPRYIAVGMFILGLGCLVFSLPHFITGPYQFSQSQQSMCMSSNSSVCDDSGDTSLSNYRFLFYVGQMLNGLGAAPLYTLAVTYMDDCLPVQSVPMYTGILFSFSVLGPAVGFLGGGLFLNLYTDFDRIDVDQLTLDSTNPRWVGAWWLGFVIATVCAILISIPLFGFPKKLPGTDKYREEKEKEVYKGKDGKASESENEPLGIKHIWKCTKALATNPTFMFLTLGAVFAGILFGGFQAFAPKFLQYQMSISAGQAALYFGYVGTPTGAGGTFLGGWLSKRFNLSLRQVLKFCFAATIPIILVALLFLFHCGEPNFAGINIQYQQLNTSGQYLGSVQLNATCNSECGCTMLDFNPVCGRDNIMYYSPCYAGCTTSFAGDKTKYSNCSCVMYNYTAQDIADEDLWMVQEGSCSVNCPYLPAILTCFGCLVFFSFLPSMPLISAILRCVTHDQRTFALGIQWIILRSLGFVPGPIIVGKLFDMACSVFQTSCSGRGACFFYDMKQLSYSLMALTLVCSALASFTFLLALIFYRSGPSEDETSTSVDAPSFHTSTSAIDGPLQ